jgi:enoyl-CoA hydratase
MMIMVGKTLQIDLAEAGVALLTLDDQPRRNAVTPGMRDEIVAAFAELEGQPEVRAVVITGAGRSFCAGADLGNLASATGDDLRSIYDAFLTVAKSPLPTIAAVNGHAVGAGLNLALACDIRIAGRSARFVTGFLRLGLHPGGGSTWMLQQVVGPQLTAAMVLLGEELDGEAAERARLVLRCVDDDAVVSEALALAQRAARAPAALVHRVKSTLREIDAIGVLADAVDLEFEAQAWSSKQDFFRERIVAADASADGRVGGS